MTNTNIKKEFLLYLVKDYELRENEFNDISIIEKISNNEIGYFERYERNNQIFYDIITYNESFFNMIKELFPELLKTVWYYSNKNEAFPSQIPNNLINLN